MSLKEGIGVKAPQNTGWKQSDFIDNSDVYKFVQYDFLHLLPVNSNLINPCICCPVLDIYLETSI